MLNKASRAGCVAVAAALAVAMVSGCSRATVQPTSATRPAQNSVCAGTEPIAALSGFELDDRSLPSIGASELGRYERYRRGAASVEIGIGFDLAEPLEDLDFEGSRRIIEGRNAEFLRSGVHGDLYLVRWREGDSADTCALITIAARGLNPAGILRIVRSIRLSKRSDK